MKQKIIYFSLIILGMIFLLYLMNNAYYQIRMESKLLTNRVIGNYVWMSLLFFFFGVLIEWKALYRVIKGQRQFRWPLFIVAFILFILTFIPGHYWMLWFGLGHPFFVDILWKTDIRALLTAFSGILFIRSIDGKGSQQ